ncbi:MAG: AAA family ATPase [Thermoplasmatota archaeon]
MPGSGKGEVSLIASQKGVPVFSMGDVVREFFSRNCPERDPIETGIYADMERKRHGKEIWAGRLIDTIDAQDDPSVTLVMIDGLRSRNEANLFRSHWGANFRIMAVHSSPEKRFRRLLERGRSDDPKDRKKFDERDQRELIWGLGEVIALADIVLVNEEDLDTFHRSVEELLRNMEGGF